MSKRAKGNTLTSIRLRSELCETCDANCRKVIRCQNPRCHARFDTVDDFEVYDDCAICPVCEVPMPSYDVYRICPGDLPAEWQQEMFA